MSKEQIEAHCPNGHSPANARTHRRIERGTWCGTSGASPRREIYADKCQSPFWRSLIYISRTQWRTCCVAARTHAVRIRLPRARDSGFTVTRSTARAYISPWLDAACKGSDAWWMQRRTSERKGGQRRDISTLEIGQSPCVLKPRVLILLNLVRTLRMVALIHLRRDYFARCAGWNRQNRSLRSPNLFLLKSRCALLGVAILGDRPERLSDAIIKR